MQIFSHSTHNKSVVYRYKQARIEWRVNGNSKGALLGVNRITVSYVQELNTFCGIGCSDLFYAGAVPKGTLQIDQLIGPQKKYKEFINDITDVTKQVTIYIYPFADEDVCQAASSGSATHNIMLRFCRPQVISMDIFADQSGIVLSRSPIHIAFTDIKFLPQK